MSYLYMVDKEILFIKVTDLIPLPGSRWGNYEHVSVHFHTKNTHCKQQQVYIFKDHLWNVPDL